MMKFFTETPLVKFSYFDIVAGWNLMTNLDGVIEEIE